MKLDNLNLRELSREEMVSITGGSWIGRVWKWIKSHFIASAVEVPNDNGGYDVGVQAGVEFTF